MISVPCSRSFLDTSVDVIVETFGAPVPRLGIPSVKMVDGPNGIRGESWYKITPAIAFPNATCLAASFSHATVKEVGRYLAEETKAKGAFCVLAPTVNIARNPLGGRTFESFSEDPTLSGLMAASYISALQDQGVSATIKHLVCNDQEHERMGIDCRVGTRALREVYLRPFQIAQRLAQPWSYMTAYNKLNGLHCSENDWLLQKVVRQEWQHDGLIVSDWFGTYSATESVNAGLNIEMPGPAAWRTPSALIHLINANKVDWDRVDEAVLQTLRWVQRLTKINGYPVLRDPSSPPRTPSFDPNDRVKALRSAARQGIVLLKNDRKVLPIRSGSTLVVGPNARTSIVTGGGSAFLLPSWSQTPWEALNTSRPRDVLLTHSLGCRGGQYMPLLDENFTVNGIKGFELRHYPLLDNGDMSPSPTVVDFMTYSEINMNDFKHESLGLHYFTELLCQFTAPLTGQYEFGLIVTGSGWLWLDDTLVVDHSHGQKRAGIFYGNGTDEKVGKISVIKGRTYRLRVLHDTRRPADAPEGTPFIQHNFRLGAAPLVAPEALIAEATALARQVDRVLIIGGLGPECESEGFDRQSMSLPGHTNDLISSLAEVNKNVVVAIQAGSIVGMPWIDNVAGLIYAWYGGNEAGNALADVIYGRYNPAGRLPITLPKSQMDISAGLNTRCTRGKIQYEEGIWVGYKHHNARKIPPLFPFGHGLSYTTFAYSELQIRRDDSVLDINAWRVKASVRVTNTGDVQGDHSVHFYTSPPEPTAWSLPHPEQSLQAFARVESLAPGESTVLEVFIDKYGVSHWDDLDQCWKVEPGQWHIKIGADAQTMIIGQPFDMPPGLSWRGL